MRTEVSGLQPVLRSVTLTDAVCVGFSLISQNLFRMVPIYIMYVFVCMYVCIYREIVIVSSMSGFIL